MLKTANQVAELAGVLGTGEGATRVKSEIDELTTRLSGKQLPFSREELFAMETALASLSGAISEMNRIARAMLAEAGVIAEHVG